MKGNKRKLYHFTVLIEKDEDGFYVATVPALKSCYTQAKTLEELYPRIKEVIALCLEEQQPQLMQFIGIQQVEFAV
jgi:predicted RNase H-like HicB family nuclease